tara:strand:+ start:642 stop:1499 length:858 start_codon:yes stop_codon:yes gene_type:complete
MTNSNQNDYGRALEYAIVDYIQKNHHKVLLTCNALQMQKRDSIKFEQLQQNLKDRFLIASQKFLTWFLSLNVNKKTITIDRFNDNSGSVSDLSLNNVNFSIKHNHDALKHPRPYSLAQQCGFAKGSDEDKIHRKNMFTVSNEYRDALNKLTKYNQDKSLLYKLYENVNKACVQSLNEWLKVNINSAFNFFNFIVGTNFYKIIVKEDTNGPTIEIQDFLNVPQPSNFVCRTDPDRKNYLNIKFNHNWVIDLRLHNAATDIELDQKKQLSLKFDARKIKGKINSQYK